MKAITRTQYGPPEVLSVSEIDRPVPTDDELLIKVHCTTVNRTDCGILTGTPFLIRAFTGLLKPKSASPGSDFAGVVEAVGSEVEGFKKGDRVFGLNDEGLGSYREYFTFKPKKSNQGIVKIPDGFDFDQAVSGAEGLHYALNSILHANPQKGDKVLVNGATGAIGSASVQILNYMGMEVTAVGNTRNMDLLEQLGAAKVYNYEVEDFTQTETEKFPFILDAVGKSSFGKCKPLLTEKGIYISSELGPGNENLYLPFTTKFSKGPRLLFTIPTKPQRSLDYSVEMMEAGAFQPVIDSYYPPEKIKEAFEYVMSGEKTGNVILDFRLK